jgi:hypothetical protein
MMVEIERRQSRKQPIISTMYYFFFVFLIDFPKLFKIAELREFKGLGQMIVFFHIAFKLMNVFMIGLMIYFLTVFIGYRNPFWGFSVTFFLIFLY